MEEVLVVLFHFIIELLGNILGSGIDFGIGERKDKSRGDNAAFCFFLIVLGGGAGFASLLLVDHTLLRQGWVRIANLVASPLFAGWISMLIAATSARCEMRESSRSHFWYAFSFSLGFALIRFVYAVRPV